MLSDKQHREIFHFCFLEQLLRISDARLFVLKGGVNLRFFFNSPRYSEDLDVDVLAGGIHTLKKNGYKILSDSRFKRALLTYGIENLTINDPLKAKHTAATQRFRLRLTTNAGEMLPTRIEFSRRRKENEEISQDVIDPRIALTYHRLSFRCQHYSGKAAVFQKIEALANRKITQARDAFDLYLLYLGGFFSTEKPAGTIPKITLERAIENLSGIHYEDFQGQVLAFVEEEVRPQYESQQRWKQMKETILKIFSNES